MWLFDWFLYSNMFPHGSHFIFIIFFNIRYGIGHNERCNSLVLVKICTALMRFFYNLFIFSRDFVKRPRCFGRTGGRQIRLNTICLVFSLNVHPWHMSCSWNCITTNVILFIFSRAFFKSLERTGGRQIRLNTIYLVFALNVHPQRT